MVTIRSTVKGALGGDSIVIPLNTQPGDLLLLQATAYNVDPTDVPAGWSTLLSQPASGNYTMYNRVLTKVATQGDAGATVDLVLSGLYGALSIVVLANATIETFSGYSTTFTNTGSMPGVTLSRPSTLFLFSAIMLNAGGTGSITSRLDGTGQLLANPGASFSCSACLIGLIPLPAGAATPFRLEQPNNGAFTSIAVYVAEVEGATPAPAPTTLQLWPR